MASLSHARPAPAHAPRQPHTHRPRLATPVAARPGSPARLTARSLDDDGQAVLAADDLVGTTGRPVEVEASPQPGPSTTPAPSALPDWHPLAAPPLWTGTDASALDGPGPAPPGLAALPPAWRLLLLSDGSVTRHLQLLTGGAVEVQVLDQRLLEGAADLATLPPSAREIAGPILQRRVLLRVAAAAATEPSGGGGGGRPTPSAHPPALIFATSWWNVADAAATLATTARPIWTSLASTRSELFREIRGVECGGNPALSRAFGLERVGDKGVPTTLWGRHYLFHRGGRPLTAIYEVFSPRLGEWLGASAQEEEAG